MTLNLDEAVVFDIETYPNAFTLSMELLFRPEKAVWEISDYRDDRHALMQWFTHLSRTQTPMIGFNSINFDYPVIHYIFNNPHATVQQIYEKAQSIIKSFDPFGHIIWDNQRFAPQIDLFKINHFDNKAKSTSLKFLQINMRSPSVEDCPLPFGIRLRKDQIDGQLVPYNEHDVSETKQFALINMQAIKFRKSLIPQFGIDIMNWNDTKIGEQTVIKRLPEGLCFDRSSGRKVTRRTLRSSIALNDIIFPYVRFESEEFNRVLNHLRTIVLNETEIKQFNDNESGEVLKTKGVLTGLNAVVGGLQFDFGTGGIHASLKHQVIKSTDDWLIKDIDVGALYPSVGAANKLFPEHLGYDFVVVYSQLPKERREWQVKGGKKCVEANTLKLASNGVYGKSNSIFSPFYDPKFMISITVNGQLILCMLAEQLMKIPTLKLIQCNTDGITYYIHKDHQPFAEEICKWWETLTGLVLENTDYNRMFIRDVNNYVAEGKDGSLKLKGAYWYPDPLDYHNSISSQQPPAWHKNLSNCVSVQAAVAHMVHGVDIAIFIKLNRNPYDFMKAVKVKRSDTLYHGQREVQRTTRFFISKGGAQLSKNSPPTGKLGSYKKANGISDAEYNRVMLETGGQWDVRVCTKNGSKHEIRESDIVAGYNATICNDVRDFNFDDINYDWYISEAVKLVI